MEDLMNGNNGEVRMTSLDVAKITGKRHDNIMRDIENIINRNQELSKHFKSKSYINSRNKEYPMYSITEYGYYYMLNKYKHKIHNSRFEYKFKELLTELMPNLKIEEQKVVGNYRLDFFIEECNMIIEYDEKHHKYQKESDIKRIKEVRELLSINADAYDLENYTLEKLYPLVRIKEGEEIKGIRDIIKVMKETDLHCDYIVGYII